MMRHVARLKKTTLAYSKKFMSESIKCRSPFKMSRYRSIQLLKLVLVNWHVA